MVVVLLFMRFNSFVFGALFFLFVVWTPFLCLRIETAKIFLQFSMFPSSILIDLLFFRFSFVTRRQRFFFPVDCEQRNNA